MHCIHFDLILPGLTTRDTGLVYHTSVSRSVSWASVGASYGVLIIRALLGRWLMAEGLSGHAGQHWSFKAISTA